MRDLYALASSKKARNATEKYGPDLSKNTGTEDDEYNGPLYLGVGVGRRNKYTKWVSALGAKDLIDAGMSKGASTISGMGVGRRKKYTKWVDALGAKDLIDAGMSKGASTISGMGVGRRKKYTKWVDALGAKDLIDAGMSKGASTISGMGMTKKQAISALQMANAMYGDQAMTQLKKHRRKLSGMALYPAGM
jgi:phage FluMu protein gp41